jgi:hypothetical protein
MNAASRLGLLGTILGGGLAVFTLLPQVQADLQGVKVMGYAEGMFLLSLPTSFLSWLLWLFPATTLFGPDGNEIPRWVAYTWMGVTPPLNWGLAGWLLGRWRDRRARATDGAT